MIPGESLSLKFYSSIHSLIGSSGNAWLLEERCFFLLKGVLKSSPVDFDYLKEVDNRSFLETTSDVFRAFGDRVGVSADAYNADRLLAVELEQMVADGVVDTTTAVAINVGYITNQATLAIAEG